MIEPTSLVLIVFAISGIVLTASVFRNRKLSEQEYRKIIRLPKENPLTLSHEQLLFIVEELKGELKQLFQEKEVITRGRCP